MKNKIKIAEQQNNNNRILLKEAIPLNTPLSLQFELSSACNFKCKFCMHGNADLVKNGILKIGHMPFSLFKKIVDNLKDFPEKLKFTSLQCRGESMLNPDICQMVAYLKNANVSNQIVLSTNASLLFPEMTRGLVEAGLDVLRISIEGVSKEQYLNVAGVNIDYQELLDNIKFFYKNKKQCYVYIKTIDCGMSEKEKEKFYLDFEKICDSLYIEKPIDIWKGAGLEENIFQKNRWTTDIIKTKVCPRIFFAYAVHFDGNVVACDQDWKEDYIVGNAYNENMKDIWNGKKINKLRYAHLVREIEPFSQCDGCVILEESLPNDSLDDVKEEIICHYKKAYEES